MHVLFRIDILWARGIEWTDDYKYCIRISE